MRNVYTILVERDMRVILKWILKIGCERLTGFPWHMIGITGRLL
jgi:hypothetical protein